MTFQVYLPRPQLMPYVKHFVISETANEQDYKILPDTSLVMGFQYSGQLAYRQNDTSVALSAAGITGLTDTFRIFRNSNRIGSVLVVFTETGASTFFREPLHELFRESLALDTFIRSSAISRLQERLADTLADRAKIELIEDFLLSQWQQRTPDRLVDTALFHIHQTKGTLRINELTNRLCISQSPLEKRFRQVVGASPKKFSSIVRLQHAIHLLRSSHSLVETGLDTGYFDQAHFSKEFKAFTGATPLEFANQHKNDFLQE
ncbi:helix-turn-helix domain-containing protein [Spirosoma terrae]|uniref:AraC family transcriptional regulator n=1 Tax=Spirosoma terrae TaxID=1968276 RepID=A0A6L9L5A9_9BACT|nr:helix-turn-helix domain-containing protein [Spirosoma terrae]NDU94301.1 AraC family transcriptional regulator [Spirosoma terrae]